MSHFRVLDDAAGICRVAEDKKRITLFRVRLELDHLFVCTSAGAPQAERLVELGLNEGPPNEHPGQGTASRRFAFRNAMIELLWVREPREARSQSTARTMLWERWFGRAEGACPFGICVRPVDSHEATQPFAAWEYRPAYLSAPLSMHIGEAGLEEPMWVYLSFLTRVQREQWFCEHPVGIREITGLTLHSPVPLRSNASEKLVESAIVQITIGPSYLLEIEFDQNRHKQQIDLRPNLPLLFHL